MERAAEGAQGAQAEQLGILQTLAQQAQQQQQSFQQMTQEVLNTYVQPFNILLSYARAGLWSAQFPIEATRS
jgi:hypothetical protein